MMQSKCAITLLQSTCLDCGDNFSNISDVLMDISIRCMNNMLLLLLEIIIYVKRICYYYYHQNMLLLLSVKRTVI